MLNFLIDPPMGSPELIPLYAGHEDCLASHRFGPYIRDSYLIHYCLSGCGVLKDKYGEHSIKSGEIFIIRPGESTIYEADEDFPWSYIWIAFSGARAEELSKFPSVAEMPKEPFFKILSYLNEGISSSDIYISALYEIFHHLPCKKEKGGIAELKRYIDCNYMNRISVSDLARRFGFERSYLFRMFKARVGMGIKEYITEVKMRHAELFIKSGYSVNECSSMTGYSDSSVFSRAYKQHFGKAPSEY